MKFDGKERDLGPLALLLWKCTRPPQVLFYARLLSNLNVQHARVELTRGQESISPFWVTNIIYGLIIHRAPKFDAAALSLEVQFEDQAYYKCLLLLGTESHLSKHLILSSDCPVVERPAVLPHVSNTRQIELHFTG